MNWNDHFELKNKHAILSPSQSSWLNYSENDNYNGLINRIKSYYATDIGTIVHDYARGRIETQLPIGMEERNSIIYELRKCGIPKYAIDVDQFYDILREYINDAIFYGMRPEQKLFYSEFIFGTADAISYDKKYLRIHDLKTGIVPAKFEQLMVYAALFFLEYGNKTIIPSNITTELRIYQKGEVGVYKPSADEIYQIMDKIVENDNQIKLWIKGVI